MIEWGRKGFLYVGLLKRILEDILMDLLPKINLIISEGLCAQPDRCGPAITVGHQRKGLCKSL